MGGVSPGGNAVRSAAYNACEAIAAERSGEVFYFRHRDAPVHHEVLLPEGAAEQFRDSGVLWNTAELAEKRRDAQVAREIGICILANASAGSPYKCPGGPGWHCRFRGHDRRHGDPVCPRALSLSRFRNTGDGHSRRSDRFERRQRPGKPVQQLRHPCRVRAKYLRSHPYSTKPEDNLVDNAIRLRPDR